jgi:hypothetical protein
MSVFVQNTNDCGNDTPGIPISGFNIGLNFFKVRASPSNKKNILEVTNTPSLPPENSEYSDSVHSGNSGILTHTPEWYLVRSVAPRYNCHSQSTRGLYSSASVFYCFHKDL